MQYLALLFVYIIAFTPSLFCLVFPWIFLCWSPNFSMQVERTNLGDSPLIESVRIVCFLGGYDPWDLVLQGRSLFLWMYADVYVCVNSPIAYMKALSLSL